MEKSAREERKVAQGLVLNEDEMRYEMICSSLEALFIGLKNPKNDLSDNYKINKINLKILII